MFEIFVFVNPIGIHCYDMEKNLQDAIAELDLDVSYHVIPNASHRIIAEDIRRRRCANKMLRSIFFYTRIANRALADYHAIRILYGNKTARKFLMRVQDILKNNISGSEFEILDGVIKELNLKTDRIYSLIGSDYVKESIEQDNKIYNEWNIEKTPTTVIFDNNDVSRSGILLEDTLSKEDLIEIFNSSETDNTRFSTLSEQNNMQKNNHLRIL